MSALTGLPDFGKPLSAGATQLFEPFEAGAFRVLPDGAALAHDQGRPGLTLVLVRRPDQPGAGGQYSVLDLDITNSFDFDSALAVARSRRADATTSAAPIDLGFAQLVAAGADVALPADMTTPTPLGWSTPDGARWTYRMDVTTGTLIKKALLQGTMLFRVRVDLTVRGIAPRVAAMVDFIPAALFAALLTNGPNLTRQALIDGLHRDLPSLRISGDARRDQIAEALADRLAAAFGQFTPASDAGGRTGFAFPPSMSGERIQWDLETPVAVSRPFVLWLDPLASLAGIPDKSILIRETSIPPLDLGFRDIVVAANLPKNRRGIPAIGARIVVPPAPPHRPDGINTDITFTAPDDEARITIRLAPDEPLSGSIVCYAILAAGSDVFQLESPPRPVSSSWVRLQANDFPVVFTHLAASGRLLKQASLTGSLTYTRDGRSIAQPVTLTTSDPDIAVAAPSDASDAVLHLAAASPGGATIRMADAQPGRIQIDLASFPAYGPHRVAIACAFRGDASPLRIDIETETGARTTTLTLSPDAPTATWGYVSDTIFDAGYRYRPQGGAWSGPLDPARPLLLNADGTRQGAGNPGPDDPDPPDAFEIDGVHIFATHDDPPALSYVPAAPGPELGPNGNPTLSVFKMPQMTTLQLGAHLSLSTEEETALKAKIAARYPAYSSASLRLAPITVRNAAVLIADANGAFSQLGTSPTSAFPPFAAIFSLPLTPEYASRAISAIGGNRGLLVVDYTIVEPGATTPSVKRGDVATWFPGTEGLSHVRVLG